MTTESLQTMCCTPRVPLRHTLSLTAILDLGGLLLQKAYAYNERLKQRRQLSRLDDRMLKDIGLSRADVEQETSKPFWND